jgi:hypothetical protein
MHGGGWEIQLAGRRTTKHHLSAAAAAVCLGKVSHPQREIHRTGYAQCFSRGGRCGGLSTFVFCLNVCQARCGSSNDSLPPTPCLLCDMCMRILLHRGEAFMGDDATGCSWVWMGCGILGLLQIRDSFSLPPFLPLCFRSMALSRVTPLCSSVCGTWHEDEIEAHLVVLSLVFPPPLLLLIRLLACFPHAFVCTQTCHVTCRTGVGTEVSRRS